MAQKKAITVTINDSRYRDTTLRPQRQDIPESDKTPEWYFKNAMYYLTFYNQPIGSLRFDAAPTDRSSTSIPEQERNYPVQHMMRMMMYYLGKQQNLDFNYLTQNVQDMNLQARWIKGQDVSEFVNYFRGLMLQRVSNANWTGTPVSKEAQGRYTDMYDKLEIKVLLKPIFDKIQQENGIAFNPMPQANIEIPEDIERAMSTNFIEEGSILSSDLASGIWFTNGWMQKALKMFMYTTIAGTVGFWHKVIDGRQQQDVVLPYQLAWDNRFDDDYGAFDEFRGVIENITPFDAQLRYKSLDNAQINDLFAMATNDAEMAAYNTANNINWWVNNQGVKSNTVTEITYYWRTQREVSKVKVKNKFGNDTIRKSQNVEGEEKYYVQDIAFATIVGNKYMVDWGYIDNLVESVEDPSKPEFPIKRFRPNTFLGDSVSEVSRIHKIQDEMDMYSFKIREMVGRAKGKLYWINGDKLGEGTTAKELMDDFADMGITVGTGGNGEFNDPNNRNSPVEYVDMTLDPNIHRLVELYGALKVKMGSILSASPISLGQQTRYIGYGQQQSAIAQNQLGVSYLIDGFLDFLVMNMRYAVNQAKNLYTEQDSMEVEYMIGEKGVRYLKFTKGLRFERFMISLNINDSIDEEGRKRIVQYAQAWSQNPSFGVTPLNILKLEKSVNYTEAIDMLEYDITRNKKMEAKERQAMMEQQSIIDQQLQIMKAAQEQLKEDNANYRAELQAITKSNLEIIKMMQQMQPPSSPLQNDLAQATQQQQAQEQEAMMQQQMQSTQQMQQPSLQEQPQQPLTQ